MPGGILKSYCLDYVYSTTSSDHRSQTRNQPPVACTTYVKTVENGTDKITDEINDLVKRPSDSSPQMPAGFSNGTLKVLDPAHIFRIYAFEGKTYAVTDIGKYSLRNEALRTVWAGAFA